MSDEMTRALNQLLSTPNSTLAELSTGLLAGELSDSGLYSASKLDGIKKWIAEMKASADAKYDALKEVLNNDGIRGDLALASAIVAPLGHLLGLGPVPSVELVALALLLARLWKH